MAPLKYVGILICKLGSVRVFARLRFMGQYPKHTEHPPPGVGFEVYQGIVRVCLPPGRL